jgi:hypothetical protein
MLDSIGITFNFNSIPNDPRPPYRASGLRIGTPAMTTQGMKESEADQTAGLIVERSATTPTSRSWPIEIQVRKLASAFPPVPGRLQRSRVTSVRERHDAHRDVTSAFSEGWIGGGSFLGSMLSGTLVGLLADRWLGTDPWFVITGHRPRQLHRLPAGVALLEAHASARTPGRGDR